MNKGKGISERHTVEFLGINSVEAAVILAVAVIIIGPSSMASVARHLIAVQRWWVGLRQTASEQVRDVTETVIRHAPDEAQPAGSVETRVTESFDALSHALGLEELRQEIHELRKQLNEQ